MGIILIKKNQGKIRKVSTSYLVNNFITAKHTKQLSLAISEAKNHNEVTLNPKSHRVYYILKGELIVKSKRQRFVAGIGDVIFIPKNTEYYFGGNFRALIINSPSFDKKHEKSNLLEKEIVASSLKEVYNIYKKISAK